MKTLYISFSALWQAAEAVAVAAVSVETEEGKRWPTVINDRQQLAEIVRRAVAEVAHCTLEVRP